MHATGSGGVYAVVYMYGFERRSCWQTKTSTYAHGLPFMLNAFAYSKTTVFTLLSAIHLAHSMCERCIVTGNVVAAISD